MTYMQDSDRRPILKYANLWPFRTIANRRPITSLKDASNDATPVKTKPNPPSPNFQ